MKKIIGLLLAVSMCISASGVLAENDGVKVVLDNQAITFPDAQPMVDRRDRVLVPIRFVSEAMGAEVEWLGDTKTVAIKKDNDNIRYTIGEMKGYLNDEMYVLDTFGLIMDDRTLVPLRFISELLSCSVNWDGDSKTVTITSPGEAVRFPEPKISFQYPECEGDRSMFRINLDNYNDFRRECPYYEFKIEFITPKELNTFEQDEGAINGWQKYNRDNFVTLTGNKSTIISVIRNSYTTRELMKSYKPKEGDEIKFRLTVHRKCSDETREYEFTEILKLPYPIENTEG